MLGPLEVHGAGTPAGRRVATLLARLALDCGRVVRASALIDAVWAEQLPADPSHALQTLVSRLRREPRTGRAAPGVRRLPPGARPRGGRRAGVRAARRRGRRRAARRRRRPRRRALDAGAGPVARPGARRAPTASSWRPRGSRTCGCRRGPTGSPPGLALGRGAELVAEVEALVAEHPLDERLAAHHLAALAAAGRPADALAAYERMRAGSTTSSARSPRRSCRPPTPPSCAASPPSAADNLPHARC